MLLSPLTYWDDIRSFAFHYYPPTDQTQRAHIQPNKTHMVIRIEFAVTVHFSKRGRIAKGQQHKVDTGLPPPAYWLYVFVNLWWLPQAELPTWDDGDGVFLPRHHADVLLDGWGDEALEHGNITPHGALVGHTDCVGLPEHWCVEKRAEVRQWRDVGWW